MATAVAVYGIAVAVLMAAWWGIDLRHGALRRADRAPAEIGLHLAAELLTAIILGVGSVILLVTASPRVVLVGLGMLLYTVVASPGYFLARRDMPSVVLFGALAVLTAVAIAAALLV